MREYSEMLLNVAGALANYMASHRNFQNEHISMARAAIEAMMEPTKQMLGAPYVEAVVLWSKEGGEVPVFDEAEVAKTWKAMIESALSDSSSVEHQSNRANEQG